MIYPCAESAATALSEAFRAATRVWSCLSDKCATALNRAVKPIASSQTGVDDTHSLTKLCSALNATSLAAAVAAQEKKQCSFDMAKQCAKLVRKLVRLLNEWQSPQQPLGLGLSHLLALRAVAMRLRSELVTCLDDLLRAYMTQPDLPSH